MAASLRRTFISSRAGYPVICCPAATLFADTHFRPVKYPVTNFKVADKADLTRDDNMIPDSRAPGDTDLYGHGRVPADLDIVCDLNKIINSGAFADTGRLEIAAVNGHIRPDFHVVLNNNPSKTGDPDIYTLIDGITESLAADDRAGLPVSPFF
jgi:hypothetical protein